jgi:hypothetical protein
VTSAGKRSAVIKHAVHKPTTLSENVKRNTKVNKKKKILKKNLFEDADETVPNNIRHKMLIRANYITVVVVSVHSWSKISIYNTGRPCYWHHL